MVVLDREKKRDQHPLDSFLKLPLTIQIIISFVIWLILAIAPWFLYAYLFKEPEEGVELWVFAYFVLWPPAWPIAVILILVMRLGWRHR